MMSQKIFFFLLAINFIIGCNPLCRSRTTGEIEECKARPKECKGLPEELDGGAEVTQLQDIASIVCYYEIGENLSVETDSDSLDKIILPYLEMLGGYLAIRHCDKLVTISMPELVRSGVKSWWPTDFIIDSNLNLVSIHFPKLEYVGPDGVFIYDNPELTTLEMPNLVEVVGGLYISNNPKLCQSKVEAILEQLLENGWLMDDDTDISGNNDEC
ncbi:MAG: hypothetical protein V1848_02815 [Candidatus Magasanikbacteria bacterium]